MALSPITGADLDLILPDVYATVPPRNMKRLFHRKRSPPAVPSATHPHHEITFAEYRARLIQTHTYQVLGEGFFIAFARLSGDNVCTHLLVLHKGQTLRYPLELLGTGRLTNCAADWERRLSAGSP